MVVSPAQKGKEAIIVPLVEQDVRQQEQFWEEVARESWEDTQRHVSKALEALSQEGMGLGKATDAGKRLEQQQEREEGAKEKMPEDLAGAASGTVAPAIPKALVSGTRGPASPVKNLASSTKSASKHRAQGTKVPAFKEEWGVCNKCWANNNSEECWYLVGVPLCFQCMAQKRLCMLDDTKMREQGDTLDSLVEHNYYRVVLVKRVQAVVEKAKEANAGGKAVTISKQSLVLLICQGEEEERAETDKGKKRAQVVSSEVVTLEVELEGGKEEDKEACHLVAAIEASKAAQSGKDLAGPSRQPEVLQNIDT
ncbi:hypothetical protein C0993_002947 [Termitomyces sp. T159_Od127]|nr:hypothetical protein C0993_002947 [Termitomyces sp. T159_Od127]